MSDHSQLDATGLIWISDFGITGQGGELDRIHATATLDYKMEPHAGFNDGILSAMVLMRPRTGLVRGGFLGWGVNI